MELPALAILFYIFCACVFPSRVYGYTKPNLASAGSSDCIFGNRMAVFSYYFYRSSVYMAFPNILEYYNTILLCWYSRMGIWGISRKSVSLVGDRCVLAQYNVSARAYSPNVIGRPASYGLWGLVCYIAGPDKETFKQNAW